MADTAIPDDVRHFVLEQIDSIAQLEGLLLLRAHPHTDWTVDAVAQRLFISPPAAAAVLSPLCAGAFLACREGSPASYRYAPATPALADIVDRVAETYAKQLIPVTHLIHSKPKKSLQEFANAFRLRGGDN